LQKSDVWDSNIFIIFGGNPRVAELFCMTFSGNFFFNEVSREGRERGQEEHPLQIWTSG
jgi:hypothetical protein